MAIEGDIVLTVEVLEPYSPEMLRAFGAESFNFRPSRGGERISVQTGQ